jgi:hypothetical protein
MGTGSRYLKGTLYVLLPTNISQIAQIFWIRYCDQGLLSFWYQRRGVRRYKLVAAQMSH